MSNAVAHASTSLEQPLGVGVGDRKRRDSHEDPNPSVKKAKTFRSIYYILDSESPLPTSEDEESAYSFEDLETELAKNTTDTESSESKSENNGDTFEIEYTVPSDNEAPPFVADLSSSDPEDVVTVMTLTAMCDSDLGLADDSDNSLSSIDSEIGKADYWTCIQCKAKNNNPTVRYCEKCYKVRKTWFPPPPKRKRKRGNRSKVVAPEPLKKEEESSVEPMIQQLISKSFDSGLGSSQESNFESLCNICESQPKNGAFVHGSSSHICCCYQCATKVWRTNKRCPICKMRVSKIVKTFCM